MLSANALNTCDRVLCSKEQSSKVRESSLSLTFYFPSGRHDLREQYHTYDLSSFVADVGGYMGLLLGHSILSIFRTGADIVDIVRKKLGLL